MGTAKTERLAKKLLILTDAHVRILKAMHFYRYMTALDVAQLLYKPSVLTYVREMLRQLSGGADFATNHYLYPFRVPNATFRNTERVYTLGSRGRDFLAKEVGLPVSWYFRLDKTRHISFPHLTHSLHITRFLIAAKVWCKTRADFRLADVRISYELAKTPTLVELDDKDNKEVVRVVPDAWLLFEELKDGQHASWLPVLLEVDRGTEYQQKFRQHVHARIRFIRSGRYEELFGNRAVTIAYATTGEKPMDREARRRTMRAWTQELLTELNFEKWASIFRFSAIVPEDVYDMSLLATQYGIGLISGTQSLSLRCKISSVGSLPSCLPQPYLSKASLILG